MFEKYATFVKVIFPDCKTPSGGCEKYSLCFALGLMAVTNEPLGQGARNLMWR
jgi:hypothetical protein